MACLLTVQSDNFTASAITRYMMNHTIPIPTITTVMSIIRHRNANGVLIRFILMKNSTPNMALEDGMVLNLGCNLPYVQTTTRLIEL